MDVHNLAIECLNIGVSKEAFINPKIAGFLQTKTKTGKPVIVVNEANSEERQRFTIAHEIGHFLLHSAQATHVDDMDTADPVFYRDEISSQAVQLKEIEANQFAAELLMPQFKLKKDISELKEKNLGMSEIISQLAEKYMVSQSAMAIRLNKVI